MGSKVPGAGMISMAHSVMGNWASPIDAMLMAYHCYDGPDKIVLDLQAVIALSIEKLSLDI